MKEQSKGVGRRSPCSWLEFHPNEHRLLSPSCEADLDDIWLHTARESGSVDVATRLIDAITSRFLLLARFPYVGRAREEDFGAPCFYPVRVAPWLPASRCGGHRR